MFKDYLNTLATFYDVLIDHNPYSSLFKRALEQNLNYQIKEEQRNMQQKQKSDVQSLKSQESKKSYTSFQKTSRIFYSNQFQTLFLFSFFSDLIKNREQKIIFNFFHKIVDRIKLISKKYGQQEKKKFQQKITIFLDQLQFLSNRFMNKCSIDWLYLQIFKDFESETIKVVETICSKATELIDREQIKKNNFDLLFEQVQYFAYIYNYSSKQMKILGKGPKRLFFGERSENYFRITQEQFQTNYQYNNEKQKINEKLNSPSKIEVKNVKKAAHQERHSFISEFLEEISMFKKNYETNTQQLCQLFNFQDKKRFKRAIKTEADQA